MVARGVPAQAAVMAAAALNFTESSSSNWWRDINNSPLWQDRIFHVLAVLYGIVAAIALVITISFPSFLPSDSIPLGFSFHRFCSSLILGSTSSNTIESSGIWLDHAEGLPLSQLFRQWGFVFFNPFTFCFSNFKFVVNCLQIWCWFWFWFCSSVFCFRLPSRCAEATARGTEWNYGWIACSIQLSCNSIMTWYLIILCVSVCVDCATYLTWHAQSCFLYNVCPFGSVLGWDLLSGKLFGFCWICYFC